MDVRSGNETRHRAAGWLRRSPLACCQALALLAVATLHAPANAMRYLVMPAAVGLTPIECGSLVDVKLILLVLKDQGIGVRSLIADDSDGGRLPDFERRPHHLAHLWLGGIHPDMIFGGKAAQSLRCAMASYYAFENHIAHGLDPSDTLLLMQGRFGAAEVAEMQALIAPRLSDEAGAGDVESENGDAKEQEGKEEQKDVAIDVPPVPGLSLALAVNSSSMQASSARAAAARAAVGPGSVQDKKKEAKSSAAARGAAEQFAQTASPGRLDRNIRVRELIPMLLRRGWVYRESKGSHRHYIHPEHLDWGALTVPGGTGDPLPIGTLRSILKQARIL